jgi:hypothetical protein
LRRRHAVIANGPEPGRRNFDGPVNLLHKPDA